MNFYVFFSRMRCNDNNLVFFTVKTQEYLAAKFERNET